MTKELAKSVSTLSSHTHTHRHARAHTHTHHTNTSAYSADTHIASIYKHTQQAEMVIDTRKLMVRFAQILKAKKLFARVSTGHAIYKDYFKGKSCALSFSMLQALAKP